MQRLRCWVRPKGGSYLGECLEFGLVVDGQNPSEVIEKLEESIGVYVANISDPTVNHGFIARPSRHYLLKRFIWNLLYTIRKERQTGRGLGSITMFKKDRLIPADG